MLAVPRPSLASSPLSGRSLDIGFAIIAVTPAWPASCRYAGYWPTAASPSLATFKASSSRGGMERMAINQGYPACGQRLGGSGQRMAGSGQRMGGGGLARPRPNVADKHILLSSPALPYSRCVSKPLNFFPLISLSLSLSLPLSFSLGLSLSRYSTVLRVSCPSTDHQWTIDCSHNHGR